jgi:hypothetical protein
MSELMEDHTRYLNERTHARITSDIRITYEESQFIRDTLIAQFRSRKIDVTPGSKEEEEQDFGGDVVFQSVDQIVIEGLKNIDSLTVDKQLLMEIYRGLQ